MKSIKGICASICLFLPPAVLGSPFTNGSFELHAFKPVNVEGQNYYSLSPGETRLVGWTIGGSGFGVQLKFGRNSTADFPAMDGSYHLIFSGRNQTPGTSITQIFDTLAEQKYAVTFFVGGFNTGAARLRATVASDAAVQLATFEADPPRQGYGGQQRFVFTATSAKTTLTFLDMSTVVAMPTVALDAVEVSILAPPIILSQPAGRTNVVGESVTFELTLVGSTPFKYQWLFNGRNISGATDARLSLNSVKQSDAGAYSAIVVNDVGTTLSLEAKLVVLPQVPPAITGQPESLAAAKGEQVSFRVAATGTPMPIYQWFHQEQSIPGATNNTYSIGSVQPGDSGSYSVVISNSAGVARSTTVSLTIRPRLTGMKLSFVRGFQYAIDGESGQSYAIEFSDDLQRWTSLTEVTNTNAVSVFLEPTALLAPFQPAPYRFYRAKVK